MLVRNPYRSVLVAMLCASTMLFAAGVEIRGPDAATVDSSFEVEAVGVAPGAHVAWTWDQRRLARTLADDVRPHFRAVEDCLQCFGLQDRRARRDTTSRAR